MIINILKCLPLNICHQHNPKICIYNLFSHMKLVPNDKLVILVYIYINK